MSSTPKHRSTFADHPAVRDILPLFITRLPFHVKRLRALSAAGDTEVLKLLAHKLHGAGKSFGFEPISTYAGEIEEMLLNGKPIAEAQAVIDALVEYIRCVDGYEDSAN